MYEQKFTTMTQITFPVCRGNAFTVRGNYGGSAADLALLARLTGLQLTESDQSSAEVLWHEVGAVPPEDACIVYRTGTVRMVYCREDKNFHLYLTDDSRLQRQIYGVFLWQLSIICAATAAALRGRKVQLVHCSMLEKNQRSLLLLGESGIGKSTSMRRWQNAGEQAVSDDMVLLESLPDAAPLAWHLPTWSACRESLDGRFYAFALPLDLSGVLAVTRGEKEEVLAEITPAEFFAQVYRCCFYHYMPVAVNLPEAEKKALSGFVREWAANLCDRFPPRALFAHLDGDISKTLEGVL